MVDGRAAASLPVAKSIEKNSYILKNVNHSTGSDTDEYIKTFHYLCGLLVASITSPSFDIFLAGSSALFYYMYQTETITTPDWLPTDLDWFLLCESEEGYDAFILNFTQYLTKSGIRYHNIGKNDGYGNMFEGCICTTDFKIDGISCPVSFIWYRSVHNIGSALHGFDIDICQVAIDVRERELIVSPGVKRAIATKQATVIRKFAFCKTVPSEFEVRRLTATFAV
jgi:hypothetical protein